MAASWNDLESFSANGQGAKPMVDILVRNVDEATARRLKTKAAAKGASISETAREALTAFVKPDKAELWDKAKRLRQKIGTVSGDSTDIIREWRDNQERYR
jgi:plasmid stability protein